jgi:hypothetical protein
VTDWSTGKDIESLVSEARSLWERARLVTRSASVEIYVKHARRWGLRRGLHEHEVSETGAACRWEVGGGRVAAHVAMSGTDRARLQHDLEGATSAPRGDGRSLAAGTDFPRERIDLETVTAQFEPEALREWMASAASVESFELGMTTEVLVGPSGWLAVRTRARSSALIAPGSQLTARRGFEVADLTESMEESTAGTLGEDLRLAPSAASPLVMTLVQAVHSSPEWIGTETGKGWDVIDDPLAPQGLAGGAFDDAGFPTARRTLAEGGKIMGALDGPGSYWRRSFRDPPRSLPSTIVIGAGSPSTASEHRGGYPRCRVIPLGSNGWILELPGDVNRYARTDPGELLRACNGVYGRPVATPDGPITPGLVFDGIVSR